MRYIDLIEDRSTFTKTMTHETTPDAADSIRASGFSYDNDGVFLSMDRNDYTGGGYGGTPLQVTVQGPKTLILDTATLDEDEISNWDAEYLAQYCDSNNYWAWHDDLQFVVIDLNHIIKVV